MQQRTIELNGREFVLQELPLKANAAWRREFEAKLEPLLGILTGLDKIEIDNAKDLGKIITALRDVVLRSPEMLVELLFQYSPALAGERDWIEGNVYESELLTAVTEVLQLAYPFGQVFKLAQNLSGVAQKRTTTTLPNSSSPNTRTRRGRTK